MCICHNFLLLVGTGLFFQVFVCVDTDARDIHVPGCWYPCVGISPGNIHGSGDSALEVHTYPNI